MVAAVSQKRPAPDFVTGPVTRWLRVAALLGIVALTAYVLWRYPSLPDVVPTHLVVGLILVLGSTLGGLVRLVIADSTN